MSQIKDIIKFVSDNKEVSSIDGILGVISKLIKLGAISFYEIPEKEINTTIINNQFHSKERSVIVSITGLYGLSLKMSVCASAKIVDTAERADITGEVRYSYNLRCSDKLTQYLKHPKFGTIVNSYAVLFESGSLEQFIGAKTALL